ncbi:lyase family protein [Sagittula sp. SSi028]|uniref:lyase family protein n=1 Tax=Sagittula sp. SSi028 TaxID=3400636 RepID=UPI003AF46D56
MPATPFDSIHLSHLFPSGDTARLFSDSAEIRALMLVEGALAKAQGARGTIPETAAAAIHRAALECQIDPVGLAKSTGLNGVSTPALVEAFREAMQAPEHAAFVHWGATSQDIQDTALMLRLRQAITHQSDRLRATLIALAELADAHADTPMAGRTFGQHAAPTSFGAQVAQWGAPLLSLFKGSEAIRGNLYVSLSGSVGTGSHLGDDPAALRADLAQGLNLTDPERCWHTDRSPILNIAAWFTRSALAAARLAEDLWLAAQSDAAEITLPQAGGSSTLPQKQNPVQPSACVALARHAQGLHATLEGASMHRQQRDGAAWFTEWLTLPQLVLAAASAMTHAQALAETLTPDTAAMSATLEANSLVHAEALSFALAQSMPRPKAQHITKTLCQQARETGSPLSQIAREAHPDLPPSVFDSAANLGCAPQEARSFAQAVRAAL